MTSFRVETYTLASTALVAIEAEARLAAAQLSEAGTPARYLRSIFVSADELCLHQLDAPSSTAIAEALRRAGIRPKASWRR